MNSKCTVIFCLYICYFLTLVDGSAIIIVQDARGTINIILKLLYIIVLYIGMFEHLSNIPAKK